VTQSIAILAKRRAGKSYAARLFAEQLAAAKLQTIIVDPKGDWWGIRSAADGKAPGLAITILGGAHGDLPIEVGSGEVVAKLVVIECVSVLLDLSQFRKHEVARFMSDFLESFYRLKAAEEYRSPVMLIVDEADAIAPQKPYKGEERMLGAIEDIVRRGGQRGIGCLLITQRSAVLNKNVLTQTQVLVAMRTIAPQDLAAMDAWIDVHGTTEQRKVLRESLPSLPIGDAWFWSPGWPNEEGIFKRVHISPITTFDSGATPKPGEKRIEPKHLADIDLEALRRQMAATIEKAKAEDPRELKKQIASLKAEIAAKPKPGPASAKELPAERLAKEFERGVRAERIRIANQVTKLVSTAAQRIERVLPFSVRVAAPSGILDRSFLGKDVVELLQSAVALLGKNAPAPELAMAATATTTSAHTISIPPPPRRERPLPSAETKPLADGEFRLDKLKRSFLAALAQHRKGLTRAQIHLYSGYRQSGDTSTAVAEMSRLGLVNVDGRVLSITHAGLEALGEYEELPVGRELLNLLLHGDKLPKVARSLLGVVADAYPDALARGEITRRSGYKQSGDTSTALSRLKVYGYLVEVAGLLKLAEELAA
jgi:uncharacterized protein